MEDTRKRYEIKCPHCQNVQYACKSILQELGMNDCGCGVCLYCKGLIRVIYNEEADNMTVKRWGDNSGEMPYMR